MKILIECLDQKGMIDETHLYYLNEFPFTLEEFRKFQDEIWEDAGGWEASDSYLVKDAQFETYYVPFLYENRKYWLHLMIGQGDAWTFFTDAAHIEEAKRVANLGFDLDDER